MLFYVAISFKAFDACVCVCENLNGHRGYVLSEGPGGEYLPRKGKWNVVLQRDKGETRRGGLNKEEGGRER